MPTLCSIGLYRIKLIYSRFFATYQKNISNHFQSTVYQSCNTTYALGFAYVGGACVVNKRLEKVNSVAIIEDTGGFSGIIVAAHEVGHL